MRSWRPPLASAGAADAARRAPTGGGGPGPTRGRRPGRRASPTAGPAEADRGTGSLDPQRPDRPANAAADPDGKKDGDKKDGDKKDKAISEDDVKKIVGDYLKENPGANLNNGVQTGYESNKGFVVRSAPDPKWDNWDDQCKIPFELRIRGRIQADYYYYKVDDRTNHQTGLPGNGGNNESPDFAQLEVKRVRLIFEGTAFDPNLRYHIELDGNTRGLGGVAGANLPGNAGVNATGGVPNGNTITTVDNAVRLFSAYVAYDWHPCGYEKGCGPDCPDGTYRYTPTVTGIVGKLKPMVAFEEYMGSANEQFVEYGMSNWFFDADDDNLLMGAGTQVKAFDDRLYVQALVTNGNETQTPNSQMDDYPGINIGGWWDFGGSWNEARKRWDLYGDTISDIDYSCCPVLRVGATANIVPMDSRSEYANDELNRIRVTSPAPGGETLLSELNGSTATGVNAAGVGNFAIDAADEYTYETCWAFKYKGFSLYNGWWLEDIDNIRGRNGPAGSTFPGNGSELPILYSNSAVDGGKTLLFPHGRALIAYGSQLQGGYFVVPKKLELAARVSWIRGDSGNITGNGTFTTLTPVQVAALGLPKGTAVSQANDAFREFESSYEYALGVNYYFYRELVKWQTDVSYYQGGNPASGGQSPAGFIPGVDGWMLRTQIQFSF